MHDTEIEILIKIWMYKIFTKNSVFNIYLVYNIELIEGHDTLIYIHQIS
jgi:hypothetical protein